MRKILPAFVLGLALAAGQPPAVAQPQTAPPAPAAQPAPPSPPSPPATAAPGATPAPPAPPAPVASAPKVQRLYVQPGGVLSPVPPGAPLILVAPGAPLAPVPPGTPLPVQPPGSPEGRHYATGPFDSIEISGSADVRFTQGPTDLVTIRGNDEVHRAIVLDVRNGKLRIDQGGSWRFWDSNRVRIEVQARELTRVSISGAGDFIAPEPVRADQLVISIAGAGWARFERLDAQKLSFQIAGKGEGQVAGTTKELVVKISGHGEFRGENLRSDQCEVSVSGVGNARIWTVEQLRLAVAGVGKIDYWGTPPQVQRKISGSATINDRGAK